MSSSVFGDPPPGTDLTASRRGVNNAAVSVTYVLAAIAIAFRFLARTRVQQASIAADDWMIVAALLSVTANFVSTIIGGYYGLGKHVWAIPLDDVIKVVQILFAYVLIYVVTVPLIKLSVILFYRRVFGMNKAMWFCVALTIGYRFSCTVAFLVCCRPVSYYWTQYADPAGGRCVYNLYPFYIGNAAANVTTDVIILLVPMPLIWRLQMRTAQKVLVCSIFLLGSFVCVASLIRIYYMTFLSRSVDITWIMGNVFIWSSVEPCIGIVCACLPTLQPLLRYTIQRIFGSRVGRYLGSSENKLSGQNKDPPMRRPRDWDESLLATQTVRVEMDSMRREDESEEGRILVETDFQVIEESKRAL
ncbi:integral membrane protein Pth11-like protein [Aspergillus eucalypticola CBS 122712]|uniref:Integral membrane protein Pth11-like protein n=1 Tax=Aspergillus eucalypticola (strain CBS 122712 / IBT 29274) TaxID=1448314 RepID=A0A317W999_ASPEC|nr:integral membrane protein Pth11-like protein [Aspergillus eucalypticola CBS 122712]PWY82709.1 integral membrane protein Pth11-like protein [Aspergillus eucalypticola CBS 122712]